MSKAYERALGIPSPEELLEGVEGAEPVKIDTKCWRCRKHSSRVPGEDFMCTGCEAYMTGKTETDPRDEPRTTDHRRFTHT